MRFALRGYTLIEIAIILVIIAILVAVVLPLYQSYVVRSRVTEGILALSQCRASISEIYQFSQDPTDAPGADNWDCGEGTSSTQFVSAISTNDDGWVTVTFQNLGPGLAGKKIHMIPQHDGTDLTVAMIPRHVNGFVCEPTNDADGLVGTYVPYSCR